MHVSLHLRSFVFKPKTIGPRTDVFHLALFAYYWLARMLPHGFAGEGLAAFDYQLPKLRTYAPGLPLGIAPVLARAMALDPGERHATPNNLIDALRHRVCLNQERAAFNGTVHWDTAAETRVGRTKAALGKDNEDRVLVCPFNDPEPRIGDRRRHHHLRRG